MQHYTTSNPSRSNGARLRPVCASAAVSHSAPSPLVPPPGYRLVEESLHRIGVRDLVFVGGMHSDWRPARRAGEAGSLRRDSVALGVAVLVS